MEEDPNDVVVLMEIPSGTQADLIVERLNASGVQARQSRPIQGGHSDGPTNVRILVRRIELHRVRAVLDTLMKKRGAAFG